MGVLINLNTSATALAGGTASAAGAGEDWKLTLAGTWAVGDKATLVLTDSLTGIQTQIGAGNITGLSPSFCFTFNNKVYLLANSTAYFGEEGTAVSFNDPNGAGNSFITMSNFYATNEPLVGIAPYQGKLAFASRRTTQIWQTDPDPANYSQTQVLANVGTFNGDTMQAIGDMDLILLADNGFRSIRVRDASDNAIVADVGVPIDAIVQPLLASLTDEQKAGCCGTVDPSANRYWGYIPMPDGSVGSIYVFSNFPSSGIAAWSTYSPSYETVTPANSGANAWAGLSVGGKYLWAPGAHAAGFTCGSTTFAAGKGGVFVADNATAVVIPVTFGDPNDGTLTLITSFIPQKFGVYKGQVWVRDTNGNIYQYGGPDNNTYSACIVTAKTPYSPVDAPATRKHFYGIDAAFEGEWAVSVSTDFIADTYKLIYANSAPSFQRGSESMNRYGTHYSLLLQETGAGYGLFSMATMHFNMGDEK